MERALQYTGCKKCESLAHSMHHTVQCVDSAFTSLLNPHLKNHRAVCVACEESSVSRLRCLKVSRDAHVTIAQSNFHVSVVVLHEGSMKTAEGRFYFEEWQENKKTGVFISSWRMESRLGEGFQMALLEDRMNGGCLTVAT